MGLPARPIYRFGDVEVDAARGSLSRAGLERDLRPQTFRVLLCLLERRGQQVTKEELIERVWKGAAVTDNSIVQCVADIREALGDDPRAPRFIKTLPRVGYRFIGSVEEAAREDPRGDSVSVTSQESTTLQIEVSHGLGRRTLLAAALAALLLAAASVYFYARQPGDRTAPAADAVVLPQTPGKRALAVMYFENQSASPELDWLSEGLADMLITNLSRARNLTVLSRQQLHTLLDRMGHGPGEKIRLETAQEVARRSRVELVLLGRFARFGERLRIEVELYDRQSARPLISEGLNLERLEQIPVQIDLLSTKLASRLGAREGDEKQAAGLSRMMTDNLEAYRCYSLALEKARSFHSTEALALLEQAVRLDPQFAMAHARIGYIHATVRNGEGERAKPHLERAFRLSQRLGEKDRLYVAAWYAQADLDREAAIRTYRQLVAQYPLETEAYWQLGFQLRQDGRYEEAADAYRQGLAVDPEAKEIYNQLGFIYSNLGRYDEAVATHRNYVELAPDEPNAHDSLGITLTEAGRYDEALGALARALELNPKFHFASLHTADVYLRLGRYRAARAEYERFLRLAPSAWDRGVGYNRLALLHLLRGRTDEASEAARREYESQKDLGGPLLVALARNDLAAAARWKARLFESPPRTWPDTSYGAQLRDFLLGTYELKSGRTRRGLDLLGEAARRPPLLWTVGGVADCLANAYLGLGYLDEAIAEYERLLALNPNYPPAYYHLARAHEQKGNRELALAGYRRFLQLWRDADADIPEVVHARRISGEAGSFSSAGLSR